MKDKYFILLSGSILAFIAVILTIPHFPVKALFGINTMGSNVQQLAVPISRQFVGNMQIGEGTPTVAVYLPLIKVDYQPFTPTPTPTQTATPIQIWHGEGIYDDAHPGIDYMGNWQTFSGDFVFQQTLHFSSTIGQEVMFHFHGSQVSLFYSQDANRGAMEIWIDDILIETINQYAPAAAYQQQWNSAELEDENHTIILRHAAGGVVDVDAFVVSDYAYPSGPGVPPLYSTSYYLNTIDSNNLYDLGCELGTAVWENPGWQDSLVILDFGMPKEWDGNFGASLFGLSPATTEQLREAVKWYGIGYYLCSADEIGSRLRIGVGTSNYHVGQVTFAHGQAWAMMVNEINAYFASQGLLVRVDAVGANDMELGWNTPEVTRAWVNGYADANLHQLYDFGDAAGCPTYYYTWWSCSGMGNWTKEDVWYIAYGAPPSYPLPLIYADSGVNAEQWHLLSIYAYEQHGVAMEIAGEMTQYQACQQLGGCDPLDNAPAEGWTYLWTYLNSDPRTAQALRYSTDILYYWHLN